MNNSKVLFLGFGYVAQFFCAKYVRDFAKISATYHQTKAKFIDAPNSVNLLNFDSLDFELLDGFESFVISIPPFYEKQTDAVIENYFQYFQQRKSPFKIIYLSATSVYGDHNGKKVNEESILLAKSVNGLARISCEKKYQLLSDNVNANIIILRLAGIYGDQRNAILSILTNKITHNYKSSKLISRTHIEDIISIINKILAVNISNQIINICDNDPCSTADLNNFVCKNILKIDLLPIFEGKKTI